MYQIIIVSVTIFCLFTSTNAQWTKIPGPLLQTGSSVASTSFHIPDKTANNSYIYALTGNLADGKIYRSRDLGRNWELIFSDDSLSKLVEVEYNGDKKGLSKSDLIVINNDSIYCYKASALAYTYNSGKTWSYRKTPNFKNSSKQRDIQPNSNYYNLNPNFGVFSDGTFVGLTKDGDLFKSTSNGKYWSPIILPDTLYKKICDLEYGKLSVLGNKCLVYFPLNVNSKEEVNNFYYLSEDNANSFVKYNFPREWSNIVDNRYRAELQFNPLGFTKDGIQVWYKGGELRGGNGYNSEKGLWGRKMAPEHSLIMRTKDSSQVIELPHYSMYYVIAVQCAIYGVKMDDRVLLPYNGDLYCYDKIDKNLESIADMLNNNFDKSFLLNDPPFPNYRKGERSCNNQILCSSFNFWSPSIDQEGMVKSIKYLNENTVQKQGENEKRRLLEESKLKREIESIKTANNSKIYKYQFNGWNYKVQKVEIVGDDKIRVKIVETPPDYYDIKEAKYQGVKLIQGADVVVDIESLINYNR